ncbi:MAG: glycosyltransferase family 2 protein [Pseudomonadota bacterium]
MRPALSLWPFAIGPGALRCAHQVRCTSARHRQYTALGDDPQFLATRPLPSGWYMLEVLLNLPVPSCAAGLYVDTGRGVSEDDCHRLPVQSGRMAKRLIHLPVRARVRFDPCQAEGNFALQHFRLVRMPRRAALDRMRRKLAGHREAPATGGSDLPDEESALWRRYDRLFAELSCQDAGSYARWIAEQEQPGIPSEEEQQAAMATWHRQPVFSVVVATHDTDEAHLRQCLESVLGQTYPHWELCIADDASSTPRVRAVLEEFRARDPRVQVTYRSENGHIARAGNSALALATGDFVALLDHDDTLAPHALFSVAEALERRPGAQIVYSDEDKLDAHGQRCDPFFKPDYAPDSLYSQNYVCHLGVYRRDLVEQVGGFRAGFEGSQDYDLLLRCVAELDDPRDVLHVPRVLYHWRRHPGSTAADHEHKRYSAPAAKRALQEHFDRCHPGVAVKVVEPGLYRPRWPLPSPAPLVSLIVPTRDGGAVLETAIESILARTDYAAFEILVVDNRSTCPRTLAYLEALAARDSGRVRVLHYREPFNFSAINNYAAGEARGAVLALVNDDIEVINGGWLDEMVRHAVRPEIACVGAKLYYPDDTLQHGGVVLGVGGVAGHAHKYQPGDAAGYFSRLRIVHNVSAVTGAALVVRREIFEAVGGFDEQALAVAFNDVDFCLKCVQAGYRNLWTPFAELYHHESHTRGADDTPEQRARFQRECAVMTARWGQLLRRDPCYNPNLTLTREDFSLSALPRGVLHEGG